ncbi:MAG: DUF1836 domain-containing protein [Bacilli bacterium]
MKETYENLNWWLANLDKQKLPEYSKLPEVNLYMEQVVSFVAESVKPFSNDNNCDLTSFMVNNYVKAKIIEPPNDRKYNRDHITHLIALSMLKSVTNLEDLSLILDSKTSMMTPEDSYNFFKKTTEDSITNVLHKTKVRVDTINKKADTDRNKAKKNQEKIKKIDGVQKNQLIYSAFRLLVESEINKMVADKILSEVRVDHSSLKKTSAKAPNKKDK